ncbi:WbqC family protein [Phnomibacter ginsenosidimutans]|uniref:Uncharacterized protein n=1 Tax=Phnomibacter ginsenosidimutans TaxID=2676868 RepID=A0A6I6G7Q6_9BACT|nr:WbqC family protein [Phnomibacter ginsenosidimutans]QGW28234.1 hypothetical protein GLV81_09110 [Phnomibacter ginsenosidimutans]
MMRKIEIQLFGPIAAFARIHEVETLVLEKQEHWQKMGYRNRFQVLGANDVLAITVPLQGGRDQKAMTADLKVDYNGRWMKEHWRTLESLYNRSPFFTTMHPGCSKFGKANMLCCGRWQSIRCGGYCNSCAGKERLSTVHPLRPL